VLKCSGVVSIVSFNGEPAAVPDHEIESIRTLVASTLPYDPCPTIKTGHARRGLTRPAQGRRRTADAQGLSSAAGAFGGSDWTGRKRAGGRGGCESPVGPWVHGSIGPWERRSTTSKPMDHGLMDHGLMDL
jgi:hypothetical protein